MTTRGRLIYDDRRGILREGFFWELDLESTALNHGSEIVYAQLVEISCKDAKECPENKAHVTDAITEEIVLDLFGGKVIGDFIPAWGLPVVSVAFAKRLSSSKLTGFKIKDTVRVQSNQSDVADFAARELEVIGRTAPARRIVVETWPNLCPHCKKESMVCAGCGRVNVPRCTNCQKITVYQPDAPEYSNPAGFEMRLTPKKRVLEGMGWDGSDFVSDQGCIFVSNRAKEWMERTHTFSVAFKPALLNIEGVEEKFKE